MKTATNKKTLRMVVLIIIITIFVILSLLATFIFICVPDNEEAGNRFAKNLEDQIQSIINDEVEKPEQSVPETFYVSCYPEYHQSNIISDKVQKYLNIQYRKEKYFIIVEDNKVKKIISGGMGWGESYGSYPAEPESEHRNGILPVSFKAKVEKEIADIEKNNSDSSKSK